MRPTFSKRQTQVWDQSTIGPDPHTIEQNPSSIGQDPSAICSGPLAPQQNVGSSSLGEVVTNWEQAVLESWRKGKSGRQGFRYLLSRN